MDRHRFWGRLVIEPPLGKRNTAIVFVSDRERCWNYLSLSAELDWNQMASAGNDLIQLCCVAQTVQERKQSNQLCFTLRMCLCLTEVQWLLKGIPITAKAEFFSLGFICGEWGGGWGEFVSQYCIMVWIICSRLTNSGNNWQCDRHTNTTITRHCGVSRAMPEWIIQGSAWVWWPWLKALFW